MDKMTRNTLALLERGPVRAGGKLECEVANRLKASSEKAEDIILKLEADGIITVGRHGSVMRSMKLAPKREAPTNDTKEEEVMEETPAVPVAAKAAEETVPDQKPADEVRQEGQEPRHEQLTLALYALQKEAGPSATFTGSSARIIATQLGITEERAITLNSTLMRLGLRKTDRTNRKKPVHRIDMETKEVTQEMLDALVTAPRETTAEPKSAFVEPVLPAQAEPSSMSIEEQLADVIEQLDVKVENLTNELKRVRDDLAQEMERFDSAADESARVISGLTEDLQNANRTIIDLRTQLAALQAPPSERVKNLLDKYRATPDN